MAGSRTSAHTAAASSLPEAWRALAPLHLPNHRKMRYLGDDLCLPLAQFAERDQFLLRRLYETLTGLLYVIADKTVADDSKWEDIAVWMQQHPIDEIIAEARELGFASHDERAPSERLSKAVHDLRGGALGALLGRLQLLAHLPRTAAELNTLFVLTRDHLKIMRNAVVGLDEPRRVADRTPKAHAMRLMLEKWQESIVGPQWKERPIRMKIDCRYEGALTECCLESAAIDRIFYNLANNAARHAAGDRMEMVIFLIPDDSGQCLRFILSNEVQVEDAAFLRGQSDGGDKGDRVVARSLSALFKPTVSSTGSGFGLTVVADFVTQAFGLRDIEEALRERYVGAELEGNTFRAWFHWPRANDNLPPKLDDFHQPEQSLSEAS